MSKAPNGIEMNRISQHLGFMSKVHQIEAELQKLSTEELREVRDWLDNFFEDQLELTDEVKAALDESRAQIAAGQFRTRQP